MTTERRTRNPNDDLLLAQIRTGYDTTAPIEVRKCCENYDHIHGCLFLPKCIAPKCKHYQEVVLKVASIEGAIPQKKAEQVGAMIRTCPDCETPLAKGQQYCPKCTRKRRLASRRAANERARCR